MPDNNKMGEQAIEQYKHVLDMNPPRDQKVNSAKGIAYLYLNMKKFDDAKKYYRMAPISIPTIPSLTTPSASSTGPACYQPRMEERAKLGMKPDENLNPKNKDQKKVCAELKGKNGPRSRKASRA
jgi:tetratricopeptide (TPR) repeat protein